MKPSFFNRLAPKILVATYLLLGFIDVDAGDPASTETLVPTKPKTSFNVIYHPDAAGIAGRADLRIPGEAAPASGYPIVVVVHGGAWMTGDKWTMFRYAQSLADRGIASLTINYRHAPEFQIPDSSRRRSPSTRLDS